MDIIRKKNLNSINANIRDIIAKLKFNGNPIKIKGSSTIQNLKYVNDYDLYCMIKDKPEEPDKFIDEINKIRYNVTTNTPTYFVSGIIFEDPEKKYRWNLDEKINMKKFKSLYKNAQFVKIDYITKDKDRFIGLDVIYYLKDQDTTDDTLRKTFREDMEKFMEEKKYFKVLKRLFGIYQVNKNEEGLKCLINYFNSDVGKKYELVNQLQSIQKLKDNKYLGDNTLLKKSIDQNLKELNIKINKAEELPKVIENLEKDINKDALEKIEEMQKKNN